ncbi:MAG: class I SAM-dependent methyltransferase [Bacteroidota bacterium]|nr:class I SAM-dependent methyltransferase [Bacteroidota bacterium]
MKAILFQTEPESITCQHGHDVHNFYIDKVNIDTDTVEAFGDEWTRFNQFTDKEIEDIATAHYFDIVRPEWINNKHVLDVGCGTGRWTKYVAKFAASVDAVDPSKAIESASVMLAGCSNVRLSRAAVNNLPFADETFDFVFSLGVLHHIPDTELALKQCVAKLKKDGHFLTYLYYNLDNRGVIFKIIFALSNVIRRLVSQLPTGLKNVICDLIAGVVYMPLILFASLFKKLGFDKIAHKLPLHFYIKKTFNVVRNDARDRFGTPLEQRFSKKEIRSMMEGAGLSDIVFSENEPYWHAVGKKK